MKNSLSFALLVLLSFSCKVEHAKSSTFKSKNEQLVLTSNLENDSDIHIVNPETNQFFPFGCKIFKQFPIEWNLSWPTDDEKFAVLTNMDSLNINLNDCFHKLNSCDTMKSITVKTFEVIELGKYDLCSCGISKSRPLAQIRYKLPDLGKYQVYYSFQSIQYTVSQKDCNNRCLEYGNLIIVDQIKSHAKIIPIYFQAAPPEPVNMYYRLFYITSYNNITVWQIGSGEMEGWVQAKYQLELPDDGDLKIDEIFNYLSYREK